MGTNKRNSKIEEGFKLNTFIDNLPGLVWFKDKQSRYLKVNKELAKRFKSVPQNKIKGKSTEEIWSPRLAKLYKEEDEKIIRLKKILRTEETLKKKNGEKVYFESLKGPLKNKQNKIIGTFGVTRDITQFKKTEAALKESRQEYQDLVENIDSAIIHLDKKGTFIYANPAIRNVLGYEPKEVIGHSVYELLPSNILPEVREKIKNAFLGKVEPYELKLPRRDGTIAHIESSCHPLVKKEKIEGLIAIYKDVTQRKEAEARLIDSYKHMGIVNRQVSVLLDLNDISGKKNKKEIINFILMSALEISNSERAFLYKFYPKENILQLISFLSKKEIPNSNKSKLSKISINSKKIIHAIAENDFKILSRNELLEYIDKNNSSDIAAVMQSENYSVLPLTEKKCLKGILVLGFPDKKSLSDQEKGFYKIFGMHTSMILNDVGAF